jgi:hypothetical protein
MAFTSVRSIFAKACLFQMAAVVAAMAIVVAAPDGAELPLMLIWLVVAGVGSLLVRCPRCAKSLFMKGMLSVPWPAANCRRCGTDLTVADPANDRT